MTNTMYSKVDFRNLNDCLINLDDKEDDTQVSIISESMSNVVSKDKLRKIQIRTLNRIAEYISYTFGPMGSNTKIITGNDPQNITSAYSKDGLKVLEKIVFQDPIEASILEEIINISRHVESEVGDGTTSTVILSSYIFEALNKIQNDRKIQPHHLVSKFLEAVEILKNDILAEKKDCTLEDIYNISMISTNGNKQVSKDIQNIYETYGMDVDLSVGISNDSDTKIKTYDGVTITEGYSDSAYVNNFQDNTSEIPNARVYYFADPIDTANMIDYLDAIIAANITEPLEMDQAPNPTVICCPRISKDAEFSLKKLCDLLNDYTKANMTKPPICIITDIVASDEIIMDDISNLCGCKKIKKYIDPEIYKSDVEKGLAPTVESVHEFYGLCEMVVADAKKTKFINPDNMYMKNEDGSIKYDENNEPIGTPVYNSLVQFLETELKESKSTESANYVGTVRKRLTSLKSNMVEYLVGGVTISDRDAKKDLVEDAIKNCRSASKYGVGYAANFEGFRAVANRVLYKIDTKDDQEKYKYGADLHDDILCAIFTAYYKTTNLLYSSVYDAIHDAEYYTEQSILQGKPFNIRTEDEAPVLCSIMLDVEILNTVSKIVSLMVTCNQCLLQAPQLNKY